MVKLQIQYSDDVWVAKIDGIFFAQDSSLPKLNEMVRAEMDRRIESRNTHEERSQP